MTWSFNKHITTCMMYYNIAKSQSIIHGVYVYYNKLISSCTYNVFPLTSSTYMYTKWCSSIEQASKFCHIDVNLWVDYMYFHECRHLQFFDAGGRNIREIKNCCLVDVPERKHIEGNSLHSIGLSVWYWISAPQLKSFCAAWYLRPVVSAQLTNWWDQSGNRTPCVNGCWIPWRKDSSRLICK